MSDTTVQEKSTLEAIKVYFKPTVFAILFLGFSSGVPYGVLSGALSYWVSKIELSPSEISLLLAAGFPYTIKFLWSPFIDQVKLPILNKLLGQRRSWLILSQALLAGSIIWLGFTNPLEDYTETYMVAFLIALFGATQDIVIDGFRIEILKDDEQAAGAALYIYGYRIAGIIFSIGVIYIYSLFEIDWSLLFIMGSSTMLVGMIAVLFIREPEHKATEEKQKIKEEIDAFLAEREEAGKQSKEYFAWIYMTVVAPFREFMMRRGWFVFILFAIFYKIGDSMAVSLQTRYFLSLGFDDLVIANSGKLVGFWALFIGFAVGGWLMSKVGLWKGLLICAILQLASNFSFSALYLIGPNAYFLAFTMGFEQFATGMGATVLVAFQSLLCNRSFTVTQYALLSALNQFTVKLLSAPSGFIVEGVGWFWFFIITAVVAVPGILLLFWIKRLEHPDEKYSEMKEE
ncbi:AmpG family muropeptide MFS transporter [Pseudemcibacter aquimaris]|uniref:AmpG family muropeptide MFS transporter n=1 Tax=Pseudemcibacter aquimaris TaxID=2857064 RepID=UPI0020129912|nr:MFS transporter [Pseudemcibacter aquimaris]MCC3862368.1 MFS transporter [Pseudemcibacter aquimaris]WDU59201.1 MFS transporter [Pseudemcibacter aquimaris]